MKHSPEIAVTGQFYLVPCALVPDSLLANAKGFVPVLTPAHSDPDLGADYAHYHIDYRFVDATAFARYRTQERAKAGYVVLADAPISMMRRKAKRPHLSFPEFKSSRHLPKMERRYADCSIDLDNPVCPHKGICLQDAPIVDGVIVCPGHGLGWDAATGANVPRHQGGDDVLEARADYNQLCELAREANDLCHKLDFREGMSLLSDGKPGEARRLLLLKKRARERHQRRSSRATEAYEALSNLRRDAGVIR